MEMSAPRHFQPFFRSRAGPIAGVDDEVYVASGRGLDCPVAQGSGRGL